MATGENAPGGRAWAADAPTNQFTGKFGKKRIGILGAGAIGSVVGGMLAKDGHDVTLVDPWCANTACNSGCQSTVPPQAMCSECVHNKHDSVLHSLDHAESTHRCLVELA